MKYLLLLTLFIVGCNSNRFHIGDCVTSERYNIEGKIKKVGDWGYFFEQSDGKKNYFTINQSPYFEKMDCQ